MKEIQLTQGKVAIVDDADFESLSQFKWCAERGYRTFYAVRGFKVNGKSHNIRMHNQIIGEKEIDHRDGNGLNNQRDNLRACSNSENRRNQLLNKRNTSGFKGVGRWKGNRRWTATICVNNQRIHIGQFDTPLDAAIAYDTAALVHHGEFASTNQKLGLLNPQ